jgi:hypothetical protein
LQHREPQLHPRGDADHRFIRAGPQIVAEHGAETIEADAAARQLLPIAGLGQKRFAAEDFAAPADRLFELKVVFKGVQRVVVNEDGDWALGREKVRRVLEGIAQAVLPVHEEIEFAGVRVGDFLGRFHSNLAGELQGVAHSGTRRALREERQANGRKSPENGPSIGSAWSVADHAGFSSLTVSCTSRTVKRNVGG